MAFEDYVNVDWQGYIEDDIAEKIERDSTEDDPIVEVRDLDESGAITVNLQAVSPDEADEDLDIVVEFIEDILDKFVKKDGISYKLGELNDRKNRATWIIEK